MWYAMIYILKMCLADAFFRSDLSLKPLIYVYKVYINLRKLATS